MAGGAAAIRVLGTVEATGDAGDLGLGERSRSLLAVLLARRGHVVGADALVDAAWGADALDRTAALHTQISRLRRALADAGVPATIETRGAGYVLVVEPDDVDADRFEDLCQQAARRDDPATAARLLGEALALWRGPAFGDVAETDTVRPEAVRLDERRLLAVEARAAALLDAGRPEQVIGELEGFVEQHPLRERAMGTLMQALYACERQADALRRYQQHRERLADELGIEPSVTLQRLELEVLQQQLPVASTGEGQRRAPAPLDSLPISYLQRRDGRSIANTTIGVGPRVVSVPAWVTSLEVVAAGRDPRSSLLERLAHHVELTMYDRLGTGLSPGSVDDFSLGTTVGEVLTVLEHTGPAALLAVSQAGPAAICAAAERPDLVTHLVLLGTFADAGATFPDSRTSEATVELTRAHWGLGSRLLAGLYRPGASDEVTEHLARVMRDSAPPEVAIGHLEEMFRTDVSDRLADLSVPALVLHYTEDRVIPFAGGQALAAGLPGCTFIALPGRYHLPDVHDLDRIVQTIVDFVGGPR